ncbi:hypothetical protein GLYMA_13G044750v4 [Glycine max]|nr:hypothetical protein GLYMA_13G044750v4 [Glycine max]KAH1099816.1 hypothetical protein GYH30_035125 [Glycine max]
MLLSLQILFVRVLLQQLHFQVTFPRIYAILDD